MMKYIGYRRNIVQKHFLRGVVFFVPVLLLALGFVCAKMGQAQSITDYDGPRLTFKSITIKPFELKLVVGQPVDTSQSQTDKAISSSRNSYEPPFQSGGRFVTRTSTLASLINRAYGIASYKLSGTPSWGRSLPFSIEANAGYDAGEDEMKRMIRSLLEDRFGLKIRREMRDVPFYALEVSQSGHKLQPTLDENGNHLLALPDTSNRKLTKEEIEAEMESMRAANREAIDTILKSNSMEERLEAKARIESMRTADREERESRLGGMGTRSLEDGGVYFYGTAVPIESMLSILNSESVYKQGTEKYRIIDRTGLAGLYTFKMEYYSTGGRLQSNPLYQRSRSKPASDGKLAGPSLNEAFEQQLGLKMRLDHGPIELFVIDAVHEPVMDE